MSQEGAIMDYRTALPNMQGIISNSQTNPEKRTWSGHFCFIQASDTQFGLIGKFIHGQDGPTEWNYEIDLTKEMITSVNNMDPKPHFIVICGDMLDAFPYAGKSVELRERQYVDFIKVFKELDPNIKLVCVCGNHDIGDEPTKESLEIYKRQFGPDFFSFWSGGVKFIVLNSQYFKAPGHLVDDRKRQEQFMKTIPDPTAKHIVLFQHIPFFLVSPDEKDSKYFNIEKNLRLKILKELKHAGVTHIYCGHYHQNAGGFYEGIPQVVTSAVGAQLGKDKCGYRLVQVYEDKIIDEYLSLSKSFNYTVDLE